MAIQLIINKELGLAKIENPIQGSFIIEELTDLVEAAVLQEFDRITERGGVLVAVATAFDQAGANALSVLRSPLTGGDGNVEFLFHARRRVGVANEDADHVECASVGGAGPAFLDVVDTVVA